MRNVFNALALCALLFGAAPVFGAEPATAPGGWDNLAGVTPQDNPVLGNQAAPVRLVEFISYTCPHCANYAAEAGEPLRTGLVRRGKVALEVRPFLRNAIDVTASLLARCGPDQRFFANHDAILAAQAVWFRQPANPDAQARWSNPEFGARMKAVAEDLGLYQIMLGQGYQSAELDQCLADQNQALRLVEASEQATSKDGVQATPSFLINGKLQTIYGWSELRPLLEAAARQGE